MKRRTINFTLVISIVLFGISSAYAQKVKLDFQSPPAESMTCGDNPNGISCIEIDSNAPRENQAVLPLALDLQALPDIQAVTSLPLVMLTDTQPAAKCVSNGGSTAATSVGGFCVASDLRTSVTGFADFAVANEIPVTGLQFLQVTLRDGSTLVGSGELLGADAPMGAVCASVGGSTAATGDTGGFCMASDLSSDASAATFSVANGLPVADIHFLQVIFSGTSQIGEALFSVNAEGAKCVSVDGSTATSGNAGGFCMASDLSTAILGVANFSVANELPAVEMHFLQATFADSGTSDVFSQGADAPMGVECVSQGGSTAASGDAGVSCVASDLSPQITGDANFSVANDLPIASMQFLQATFGEGNQPSQLDGTGALDTECVSIEGSTASTGNSEGSCLVSDRSLPTTSFANFSVANGLPVSAMHFFQVPLRDDSQLSSLSYVLGEGAPMGVAISDSPRPQLIRPTLPAVAGIAGHNNRYFRILRQRSGIEIQSSRNLSRGSRPAFWLSR